MELLNSSRLCKFLNNSVEYMHILSVRLALVSNNISELNYGIRRSRDYKYLICANKIDQFDISRYRKKIGFSKTKTKSLFINAFLKKFLERIQGQNIKNWLEVT